MRENRTVEVFHKLCEENTRENTMLFFDEVKHGTLWVPVSADRTKGAQVQILVLVSSAGKKYIPAFVSRESVCRPYKKTGVVRMEYERLKQLITADLKEVNGIVISPFQENIFIDKALMRVIDAKVSPAS